MRRELVRKTIHVGIAILFAYFFPFMGYTVGIIFAVLLFAFFLLIRVTKVFPYLRSVSRVTFGELFFALGILSAIALTWPDDIFSLQLSMVLLGIADPLASLIGMRFGKHEYMVFDEKRTYEGSLVCFAVSSVVLVFFGAPFSIAVLIGGVLAIIEALSLRGSDNLFLPMASIVLFRLFL